MDLPFIEDIREPLVGGGECSRANRGPGEENIVQGTLDDNGGGKGCGIGSLLPHLAGHKDEIGVIGLPGERFGKVVSVASEDQRRNAGVTLARVQAADFSGDAE